MDAWTRDDALELFAPTLLVKKFSLVTSSMIGTVN
jgi:hypothetical protein